MCPMRMPEPDIDLRIFDLGTLRERERERKGLIAKDTLELKREGASMGY